jgi:hypothetical protein
VRSTAASPLMCVCHTSPAVASVSLTLFYHSGRLPRSRLCLFWCATSPAMSLPSLTVVSHSHRRSRISPPRHCAAVGVDFAVPVVASGSGVRGIWLAPPFVVVWVRVGCWRLSFLHAVSSQSEGFADASVCACLVPCVTAVSAIRRTLCPLHIYV